jgi:hypothetical protein
MSIRQTLNDKPAIAFGLTAAIVLIAVVIIYFQVSGPGAEIPDDAFYTDDNGQTYFEDDYNKIAPFDHDGKQAFRAEVFQCGDEKPFVAIIGRYTATGKQEMEQYMSGQRDDPDGSIRQGIEDRGLEVKKVGANDKSWFFSGDYEAEKLRANVKCPDGSPAKAVKP